MPKAKPTSINVHRIEAGEWERQNILRPVAEVAKNAAYASTAAFAIVSIGVGMAGYSAYWFLKVFGGWAEAAEEEWEKAKGNFNKKREASKPRLDETSIAGRVWIWLNN